MVVEKFKWVKNSQDRSLSSHPGQLEQQPGFPPPKHGKPVDPSVFMDAVAFQAIRPTACSGTGCMAVKKKMIEGGPVA